ncbi:site-specific DNA-methyltransferase [Aquisalinus flavus]|uniref:site-specific DNA-methyltransferase (adenine-specific) n=1 Tax=Aquisalinus flavus TaxID=1526572 RepID=A0A8J2Y390_9PROT|nr:site-specific DNA-methyltransferase [Aquisalinus flavus]MBD0427402.1 site-specific DNA-methyltransferase [Aquisalinus flavus]UNE47205.1 site-specific DNA-methyltransferase [Aquisalinus flavus]GGD00691.1 site-specific DNA-methyltransferase [Aquisalinus flavus]
MARKPKSPKKVETLSHEHETRKNIPTAELQSINEQLEEMTPQRPVAYPRARPLPKGEKRERDGDLDPQIVWNGMKIRITREQMEKLAETGELELGDAQLVWRGKDTQDWSDLIVNVPPVYVQEKIHPKALIDDLVRRSKAKEDDAAPDLFADFNGIDPEARTEFYEHDQHWSNRMILGDSLQVMASLAEREQLRGKVQCIYFDPPYGIRFNSNWQVSTRDNSVSDGKASSLTREPEQVKAFRDTWKDGIHSYLTYLRDRMTVMRDLLTESGSIFVQIGDENMHRVRAVMDEVFGDENFVACIVIRKTASATSQLLSGLADYILWYGKDIDSVKYRKLYWKKVERGSDERYDQLEETLGLRRPLKKTEKQGAEELPSNARRYQMSALTSTKPPGRFGVDFEGKSITPRSGFWKTGEIGFPRLIKANRVVATSGRVLRYVRYLDDFPVIEINSLWDDISGSVQSRSDPKVYVVQTGTNVVARCILMATDPGDLVIDPTCGSGTTATVAEQWGRRWITVDTSRVALALARTRLMSAKYPYYLLADSSEGKQKEGELTGKVPASTPATGDIRQGFVYERAPHITLKSIANNAEIDVIWDKWQETLEPLREKLNATLGQQWEEWEIPRAADDGMPDGAKTLLDQWWEARIARQKEIDASIARKADVEYLYDRPYEDKSRIRVAGPFTVESLSPHRVVAMDDQEFLDEPTPQQKKRKSRLAREVDFVQVILENLRTAGVQQGAKEDRINFTTIAPWPGEMVHAEGRFMEGEKERRAAIMIGPEYGTLHRTDIMAAAREASEARFDILITCAFGYDAHASDVTKLGPLRIIKAKMNPDLHMAEDLRRDKNANLFMVIGEPDVDIIETGDDLQVKIHGMDVFVPATGEIRSGETDDIAAWFIDTDYNEESFFVRHAYFLGGNDPYASLKSALKAEIDEEAWETLRRDTSRPFPRPESGRIAVKVINHYGDEVMKVFSV